MALTAFLFSFRKRGPYARRRLNSWKNAIKIKRSLIETDMIRKAIAVEKLSVCCIRRKGRGTIQNEIDDYYRLFYQLSWFTSCNLPFKLCKMEYACLLSTVHRYGIYFSLTNFWLTYSFRSKVGCVFTSHAATRCYCYIGWEMNGAHCIVCPSFSAKYKFERIFLLTHALTSS